MCSETKTVYAIIATGGKQYRVEPGQRLEVEKLTAEAGSQIDLGQVLLIGDGDTVTVGQPTVAGARVALQLTPPRRPESAMAFRGP
jgi:large subunit ribosomal protein L21